MIKNFTIIRKRIVTQVLTTQVQASSETEALEDINDRKGEYDEGCEWHTCSDPDYVPSTTDDILEAEEVEVY